MNLYLEFGELCRQLRLEAGYVTKKSLADKINKDLSYIGKMEAGQLPHKETLQLMIKAFNTTQAKTEKLKDLYNNGQIQKIQDKLIKKVSKITTTAKIPSPSGYNLETDKLPVQRVPVISWVHAGHFDEVVVDEHTDNFIYTSATGKNLFALVVNNDCMEPRYCDGDTIVVDPDIHPEIGDYVIARDSQLNEMTFKQLKQIGDMKILHPLNPKYEDIPLNHGRFSIIGKVVRGEIR